MYVIYVYIYIYIYMYMYIIICNNCTDDFPCLNKVDVCLRVYVCMCTIRDSGV
jgi:hypothetical protein